MLDARAIVGAPEGIVRETDGCERCELKLRLPRRRRRRRLVRVGLDAPRAQVEEMLRKVLG
ncbi:MAG: hypothetical protein U0625_10015 [Phycisphaerales bacterium]